jgi:putative hemolysin
MAVVTATVVVTLFFLDRVPRYAELYALLIMSPLLLLMGEVIPKSLFQQHADYLATRVVYPLVFFRWVFSPLLVLLNGFTHLATRLLGVEGDRALVTREELQNIIETVDDYRGGEITSGEAEMISNVLDVEDREAEDVMLPISEVCSVPVDESVYTVIQIIREKRHTRIPVYSKRVDNIVGLVQAFDLINVDPSKQTIRSLMHPPHFIPESQTVLDLVKELQSRNIRMAVVVNEYGGAEGVVTLEDALEEIVGEIDDEYDTDLFNIKSEGGGRYLVEARVPVERLNKELGLDLPEDEEYETVAGLVLERLRRMPSVGVRLLVKGVAIEMVEVSDRALETVRIEKLR